VKPHGSTSGPRRQNTAPPRGVIALLSALTAHAAIPVEVRGVRCVEEEAIQEALDQRVDAASLAGLRVVLHVALADGVHTFTLALVEDGQPWSDAAPTTGRVDEPWPGPGCESAAFDVSVKLQRAPVSPRFYPTQLSVALRLEEAPGAPDTTLGVDAAYRRHLRGDLWLSVRGRVDLWGAPFEVRANNATIRRAGLYLALGYGLHPSDLQLQVTPEVGVAGTRAAASGNDFVEVYTKHYPQLAVFADAPIRLGGPGALSLEPGLEVVLLNRSSLIQVEYPDAPVTASPLRLSLALAGSLGLKKTRRH